MPTRPLTDLDRELRKDPEYEAALEELQPYEQIARQLVAFRIENCLSQAELARRCGVSQPAVARLERGIHLAPHRGLAPCPGGAGASSRALRSPRRPPASARAR